MVYILDEESAYIFYNLLSGMSLVKLVKKNVNYDGGCTLQNSFCRLANIRFGQLAVEASRMFNCVSSTKSYH